MTEGPDIRSPWEGLMISETTNAVIHLSKHSSKEILINAITELDLTPDNLVTIYASAYFDTAGLDKETRGEEAEQLL